MDRQKSLSSIRKVDEKGYLYEMTYYADYYTSINRASMPKSLYSRGGCSVFAARDKRGRPIFARNYDWKDKGSSLVVLHIPAIRGVRFASLSTTDGGHVGISPDSLADEKTKEAFLYTPFCGASDGINEKGFCVSIQILYSGTDFQDSGKPSLDIGMVARFLLDKAESVDHAIELLSGFDVTSAYRRSGSLHWLIADASGKRAVIEVVDGRLCIIERPVCLDLKPGGGKPAIDFEGGGEDFLLSTNFYIAKEGHDLLKGSSGGYWRYCELFSQLKDNPDPDAAEAMEMLKNVRYSRDIAVNFYSDVTFSTPTMTLSSAVYEVEERKMSLCLREDYEKIYRFSLISEEG